MNDEIRKLNVTDRESFIKLVKLLRNNFHSNLWENNNLADYLEAMSSYTEDLQGYYDNSKQPVNADIPSWRVFADILIGATMYE